MKKSLIALAVLAAASAAAQAQSSVTIYGKIDLGLVVDGGNPEGHSVRVSSGAAAASRLGFRGTEDLGGGYKAGFQIETGFCSDSAAGAPNYCSGGNFMGRQAHGDLSGPFGTLTAGRQFSLGFDDLLLVDPFVTGYAGKINNVIDPSATRLNNSVQYTTPTYAGFSAAAEAQLGETTGDWEKGFEAGGALHYLSRNTYASFMFYDQKNANGIGSARKNFQLEGTYDLNFVKLAGLVQRSVGDPTGTVVLDTLDYMAGATIPVAGGWIMTSYIHQDDKSSLHHDADQVAAGYNYPLSKRTFVYTAWARIVNKNGGTLTVGNSTDAGTGPRSFNLGVLHNF